jgi:hypothetical protein
MPNPWPGNNRSNVMFNGTSVASPGDWSFQRQFEVKPMAAFPLL